MTDAALPRYCAELLYRLDRQPFEKPANDQVVYLAADVDARLQAFDRAYTVAADAYGALSLQHTEVTAEVVRLTRDRDEARAALRLLATELREEAGPPVEDTAENFPGGHDMTERRFLLQWFADRLDVLARPEPA